jgi:hypothetical protein
MRPSIQQKLLKNVDKPTTGATSQMDHSAPSVGYGHCVLHPVHLYLFPWLLERDTATLVNAALVAMSNQRNANSGLISPTVATSPHNLDDHQSSALWDSSLVQW